MEIGNITPGKKAADTVRAGAQITKHMAVSSVTNETTFNAIQYPVSTLTCLIVAHVRLFFSRKNLSCASLLDTMHL